MVVLGINREVMQNLVKGLDVAHLRLQVTAHNQANLNTPYFKRSYVSFDQQLKRAGLEPAVTAPGHLKGGGAPREPQVKTDNTTIARLDGNNVDLEREMLDLVTNQLRYNALVQQVSERYNTWRYVINEGRR